MSTPTTTPTSGATSAATTPGGARSTSARRVMGMARANLVLQLRNKLTAAYALVLPLIPLAFLLAGDRGDEALVPTAVGGSLLMVMLFPAYYNLLSATVTRRDELVLKRLRTGEASDRDLLASLALPGWLLGLSLAVLAVPVAMALGAPAPANPLLYLVAVVIGLALFTALAFWTAAWTRNAEAAQMTSLPVIILAVAGSLTAVLPSRAAEVVERTPGAALEQLVTISWLGQAVDDGRALGFAESFAAAGQPVLVMLAWTALGVALAARSMRWEPRH